MTTAQIANESVPRRRASASGCGVDSLGPPTPYELIREDIIEGVLPAGSRLKVSELARRYGTSTNPVREALQQLRGEGFIVHTRNRGARVRTIDDDFLRNIYEITALLEPYMARWFVDYATDKDVARLQSLQDEIEALGFEDPDAFCRVDFRFHCVFYDGHYNRDALEQWHRRREILRVIGTDVPFSQSRRREIMTDHHDLIDCVRRRDGDAAAEIVHRHVAGSQRHVMDYLRSARAAGDRALLGV